MQVPVLDRIAQQVRDLKEGQNALLRQADRSYRESGKQRSAALDTFVKAATAFLISAAKKRSIESIAAELYLGNAKIQSACADLNLNRQGFSEARAVTSPAQTTVPGWAMELVQSGNVGVIPSLTDGRSVYAGLAQRGQRQSFGDMGTARFPHRDPSKPVGGSFVGAGLPIPVRRLALGSVSLLPQKLGVISTFSSELAARSTPTVESVLRQAMAEDTAVAIDNVLLDSNPATTIRPAGILNGITPTPPSSATGLAGLIEDMRQLLDGVPHAVDPVFIASPSTALTIALLSPAASLPLIVAPTVPDEMLILIDANDFASAEGDLSVFDSRSESTIHEEDTAPLPLVAGAQGSGVSASPTRSLWQTDTIALRLLADVSWAMTRPARVAYVDPIGW